MFFSILNILDENLRYLAQHQVEVVIENGEDQSTIYNGQSDIFGQILFHHSEYKKASVYVEGEFQKTIVLPCLETISVKTK